MIHVVSSLINCFGELFGELLDEFFGRLFGEFGELLVTYLIR
jgi:hypothetical protein